MDWRARDQMTWLNSKKGVYVTTSNSDTYEFVSIKDRIIKKTRKLHNYYFYFQRMGSNQLDIQVVRLHLGNMCLLACSCCNTSLVYENDYSNLFINTTAFTNNKISLFAKTYEVYDSEQLERKTTLNNESLIICGNCDKVVGKEIYLSYGDGQFRKVLHNVNEIIILRDYPDIY